VEKWEAAIDLTMNMYTSLTVRDQATALASLPAIPAMVATADGAIELRATGTVAR
jgi:hypothetical protein